MKTKGGQNGDGVTNLQTASGKRVCKLLILGGGFAAAPSSPVFWQKSAELLDSKGVDVCKGAKEFAIV